jgi:hypothetical protein
MHTFSSTKIKLTVKLVYKLVDQEDKAHSLTQIVDLQNIMNNEHDMKIKVENLPSRIF